MKKYFLIKWKVEMEKEKENSALEEKQSFSPEVLPHESIFGPDGLLSKLKTRNQSCVSGIKSKISHFKKTRKRRIPQQITNITKYKKQRLQLLTCSETDDSSNKCESGNDFSIGEFAFTIDHILDNVLDSLEKEDLFSCRLVCSRFRDFSNVRLKKQVYVDFVYWPIHRVWFKIKGKDSIALKEEATRISRATHVAQLNLSPKMKLGELTSFLKKSKGSKWEKSTAHLNTFPCTKFIFYNGTIGNRGTKGFLRAYTGPGLLIASVHTDRDFFDT